MVNGLLIEVKFHVYASLNGAVWLSERCAFFQQVYEAFSLTGP